MNALLCADAVPNLFGQFDTTVAPRLLYYSYVPIIFVSLFFGFFVFFKDKFSAQGRGLLLVAGTFSLFLINEISQWIAVRADVVHFGWQMSAILQPAVFLAVFYFVYAFLYKKSLPFYPKLISVFLFLPMIILLPTAYNMTSFDLTSCESNNGLLWDYIYIFEIISIVLMGYLTFHRYQTAQEIALKKTTLMVGIASVIFLSIFTSTNIIGDSTFVYEFNLFGPLGMVIFITLLFYMAVKFSVFNLKLLATQAFVVGIWILVFGILFIRNIENVRIVVFATLVLLFILGYQLVQSVKREVKQREELAIANEGQATLIHFINHQIKGYLNKAKIVFSEVLTEPEYAPNEPTKKMLSEGEQFMTEGVDFVQQILKASDIEKGTFAYEMKPIDLKEVVSSAAAEQRPTAEGKGLKYDVAVAEGEYKLNGDATQLREAVKNFITNSILYTPSGSIVVSLEKKDGKALFKVTDTGVGLSDEVKPKLFTKGGRSVDSVKINVNSTGYGLAIVKGIAEAHKGRVWAESAGPGKGSTFFMELPLMK